MSKNRSYHEDFNQEKQPKKMRPELYWRYKKNEKPKEELPGMNGQVIVKKVVK